MKIYTESDIDKYVQDLILTQDELEIQREPHILAQQLMDYVRTGDVKAIQKHPFMEADSAYISEQGPYGLKLMEYNTVNIIVSCSHAALEAGMNIQEAYDICDTFFHLLVSNHSVENILQIFRIAPLYFANKTNKRNLEHSYLISKIQTYISRNIFHKITLENIAEYTGLTRSYISRFFSQKMGISLCDYIQREKINSSCNMLAYSQLPISVISDYYSFHSQTYYSQIFKKWTGMSPSVYRSLYAKPDFYETDQFSDSF